MQGYTFFIDLNHIELIYYSLTISLVSVTETLILLTIYLTKHLRKCKCSFFFNLITRKHEIKTFKKRISCKCKYKFASKKCYWNKLWNIDKYQCERKNPRQIVCEKVCIWNPAKCVCENVEYLKNVTDDLKFVFDEIIETTKSKNCVNKNWFNKKYSKTF